VVECAQDVTHRCAEESEPKRYRIQILMGGLQPPPRRWGISPAPITTRVPHPVVPNNDGREISIARKLLFRSFSQHRRADHVYISAVLKGVAPQAFAKLYEQMRKDRSLWPQPWYATQATRTRDAWAPPHAKLRKSLHWRHRTPTVPLLPRQISAHWWSLLPR